MVRENVPGTALWRDQAEALVLREVLEVGDIERRQREVVGEAARWDPGVIERAWAAPLDGIGDDLTPLRRNVATTRNDRARREERLDRPTAPLAEVSGVNPSGELADRDERQSGLTRRASQAPTSV